MITKKLFEVYNGEELYAYTLSAKIEVTVLTLGATVLAIRVPDKNGELVDVALGMTDAKSMLTNGAYMGAVVGRCANRIAGGAFTLGDKRYQVTQNDGANSLHGGTNGFNTKVFDVVEVDETENSLTLRTVLADGEDGYPARLELSVKYTVFGGSLFIDYYAESDGDTLCNPTNHTYFNLNGESDGNAMDNVLYINAYSYLKVNQALIPTNRARVGDTPFEFRISKPIGSDIDQDNFQLQTANGYDHCYCLDGDLAAIVYSKKTGIQMEVRTSMPGMQLYTGNFLNNVVGKSVYGKRAGFCLETQFYPNAINRDDCAKPILKKGEKFHSRTGFIFSITKELK